jgi:hypothetical protein
VQDGQRPITQRRGADIVPAMPYGDVTFTREKLYEEVWTRPVTQLAKEIGVSDVALAKICRKLNVPVPARGYWAQVAAGQSPKRPALPTPTATTPQSHVSRLWRAPEGAVAPTITEDDAPSVTVSPTLENPHRLIRTSRAYLQRAAKGYDSRVRPKDQVLGSRSESRTGAWSLRSATRPARSASRVVTRSGRRSRRAWAASS